MLVALRLATPAHARRRRRSVILRVPPPLAARARLSWLLPASGFGLWLRLAAASLVLLLPGRLVARAFGRRGPATAFVWSVAARRGRARADLRRRRLARPHARARARRQRRRAALLVAAPRRRTSCCRAGGLARSPASRSARRSGGSRASSRATRPSISAASASSTTSAPSRCAPSTSSRTAACTPATRSRSGTPGSPSSRSSPCRPDVGHPARAEHPRAARVRARLRDGTRVFRSTWLGLATMLVQVAMIALAPGGGGAYTSLELPGTVARQLLIPAAIDALLPLRAPAGAVCADARRGGHGSRVRPPDVRAVRGDAARRLRRRAAARRTRRRDPQWSRVGRVRRAGAARVLVARADRRRDAVAQPERVRAAPRGSTTTRAT